jgi:hypothetical protein
MTQPELKMYTDGVQILAKKTGDRAISTPKLGEGQSTVDGVRIDAEGNVIYGDANAPPKLEIKDKNDLNKIVTPLIKDTVSIYQTARDVEKLGGNMSGPASIAVVFKFMKALDPTSVVREGEFATAQNSSGVDDKISNVYNKLLRGEILTADQVKQFVVTSKNLANSSITGSNQQVDDLLATYGDSLPSGFKSSMMNRIPKQFKMGKQSAQNKPTGGSVFDGTPLAENAPPQLLNREQPTQEALNYLTANPSLSGDFMKMYGFLPEGFK